MKHSPLVAAGSLNRLLQAAEAAWQRKDFTECLESLERASRLAPSNASILLRLGRFYGLRYDYAAAERCFEKALRFAPNKTSMLTAIGSLCQLFRDPGSSYMERYLRRALEQPDVTPQPLIKLADLYERLRRLPEAAELVDRALRLQPAQPEALLLRARLDRVSGRSEAAEQGLRGVASTSAADPSTRALAWYELGSLLDRQQQYDHAMKAFLEAKSLLQALANRNFGEIKIQHTDLKAMESQITAGMLRQWFDNAPALKPERRLALLCGHPRSGTTVLEQVLDAHPDIVAAEETEVFIDDALGTLKCHLQPDAETLPALAAAGPAVLQQARAAYFRSMESVVGRPIADRLLLDKNPIFTYQIPAFIRIFPETKFIVALRDPRDVVLSRFMIPQPLVPNTTPFLSLKGTVEEYAALMGLWRTLAPMMPAPWMEVRYEDMVEDLESVARQTLDFLGVPWEARVLDFSEHARKKMVRSPTYGDVTQPVYKRAMGRWRNYQKYLEPCLETLEPFVKAFGYE